MSKIVSLPAAMQLEFDMEPVEECDIVNSPLYVSITCKQCINSCKIYTISESAEVFCIKYQKEK